MSSVISVFGFGYTRELETVLLENCSNVNSSCQIFRFIVLAKSSSTFVESLCKMQLLTTELSNIIVVACLSNPLLFCSIPTQPIVDLIWDPVYTRA